jgi:phosphatidylglycerol:prolipoprotein diacylglycerol transferase
MLIHPNFDPIAIHLGPVAVRWYGLMYLVAFIAAIVVGRLRLRLPHVAAQGWTARDIDDMLFYGIVGTILGGRLGYVLFYKANYYVAHPLDIVKVWQGGMSFHGGLLGVILAMWWMGRKHQLGFLRVADFVAPLIPCGLAAGRMGNFINGELWGRVVGNPADVPWGMLFRGGGPFVRHPSQLYQFALEGLLLFVLLWVYSAKPRPSGAVAALFLVGYGAFRFIAEVFREPDDFLGILALNLSMGQWLSLPMVLLGVVMLLWSYRGVSKP